MRWKRRPRPSGRRRSRRPPPTTDAAAALLEGSPEAASLPEVLVRLGDVSGRAGSYSMAAETFRRAIDLLGRPGGNPRMAEVEHRLGTALWRQEAIEDAQAAFERALALAPSIGSTHRSSASASFHSPRKPCSAAIHV